MGEESGPRPPYPNNSYYYKTIQLHSEIGDLGVFFSFFLGIQRITAYEK